MIRYFFRILRISKNNIKLIGLLLFIGTVFMTILLYILIGVKQCFVPIKGVESKTCSEIVDELIQAGSSSNASNLEPVFVHQHNIALNLTNLRFDSRNRWKKTFGNYMFHNASMARGVIAEYYPHLLKLYDSYPDNIQRADLSRIAILHHYGGVYSDIDAFPTSRSQHLKNYNINDAEKKAYIPIGEGGVVVNHFFITNKNNSFLGYLLDSYEKLNSHWKWIPLPYLRVFLTTGPCAIQIALNEWQQMWHKKGVTPAPSIVKISNSICLANHKSGRQWLSVDGKFFNWIGDNFSRFIYYLVSIILLVVFIITIFILYVCRRKHKSKVKYEICSTSSN